MTTYTPEDALAIACPNCEAPAGTNCHYGPGGSHRGIHAPRITKYRKEQLTGPEPFDVVYMDGAKFRVVHPQDMSKGVIQLRRGNAKQRWQVNRDQLSYDTGPGMWRVKGNPA